MDGPGQAPAVEEGPTLPAVEPTLPQAIREAPELTEWQREALLAVYETLLRQPARHLALVGAEGAQGGS